MSNPPLTATPTSEVLYVLDVPKDVKWNQLEAVLQVCGIVRSSGARTFKRGKAEYRSWTIVLENVEKAEMAMSTLNDTILPDFKPAYHILLSTTEERTSSDSSDKSPPPVFLKSTQRHPLHELSAQALFTEFRKVGPLKRVAVNVNVGYPHSVSILEYSSSEAFAPATKHLSAIISQKRWPDCGLQRFDPSKLFISDLGPTMTTKDLTTYFQRFGTVTNARIVVEPSKHKYAFLEFKTPRQASRALGDDGVLLKETILKLRCREHPPVFTPKGRPTAQTKSTQPQDTQSKPSSQKAKAAQAPKPPPKAKASEPEMDKRPPHDPNRATREQAARDRVAEARKKLDEAKQARFVAHDAAENARAQEHQALSNFDWAEAEAQAAVQAAAQAVLAEQEARLRREEAEIAREQAAAGREKAFLSFQSAGHTVAVVNGALETADNILHKAEQDERAAIEALAALLSSKEPPHPNPFTPHVRGEASKKPPQSTGRAEASAKAPPPKSQADKDAASDRRAADLAQSIQRMTDMRREEELDAARRRMEEVNARERERAAELLAAEVEAAKDRDRRQSEREEEQRRAKEEEDRKVREARERQIWSDATQKEIVRCTARDQVQWPRNKNWTMQAALARFQLVAEEYDKSQFSKERPLTVASIPWPVLDSPYDMDVTAIEWETVEKFFAIIKPMLAEQHFAVVIRKSQHRFHPDRWNSRLGTVMDDKLRQSLRTATITVSQAINSLSAKLENGV